MKQHILLSLLALFSIASSAQVVNSSAVLIGAWSGKLKVGPTELTLVLHIKQGNGYLECSLDSPDQGAKGIGLYKEHLTDDSVAVKATQLGATYRARVANGKMVKLF
jgi:hypothetical protein